MLPCGAATRLAAGCTVLCVNQSHSSLTEWTPEETTGAQEVHQPGHTVESVRVEARAPRDLAASSRPCLPRTSCTGSLCGCAGRCFPLRTPCTGSFSEDARPTALLAFVSLPIVLADARPSTLLAPAPSCKCFSSGVPRCSLAPPHFALAPNPSVLADARPGAALRALECRLLGHVCLRAKTRDRRSWH